MVKKWINERSKGDKLTLILCTIIIAIAFYYFL